MRWTAGTSGEAQPQQECHTPPSINCVSLPRPRSRRVPSADKLVRERSISVCNMIRVLCGTALHRIPNHSGKP